MKYKDWIKTPVHLDWEYPSTSSTFYRFPCGGRSLQMNIRTLKKLDLISIMRSWAFKIHWWFYNYMSCAKGRVPRGSIGPTWSWAGGGRGSRGGRGPLGVLLQDRSRGWGWTDRYQGHRGVHRFGTRNSSYS